MISVAWKVQAQNPPCYLCGGNPSATLANPDFVLDLTPLGDAAPVPTATCAQILQGGIAGLLTADQCALLQIDPRGIQIQIQCGCSTVSAGTTPPGPVATPTATSAPVSVTAAPVSVTAAPVSVPTAPVSVTAAPITVTAAPVTVTTAPVSLTATPVSLTTAPVSVTVAPVISPTTNTPTSTPVASTITNKPTLTLITTPTTSPLVPTTSTPTRRPSVEDTFLLTTMAPSTDDIFVFPTVAPSTDDGIDVATMTPTLRPSPLEYNIPTASPDDKSSPTKSPSVRRPVNSSQRQPSSPDFPTSAEKPIPRPRAPRKRPVQMMMTGAPRSSTINPTIVTISARPVRPPNNMMMAMNMNMRTMTPSTAPTSLASIESLSASSSFTEQAAVVATSNGSGELPTLLRALDFSNLYQRKSNLDHAKKLEQQKKYHDKDGSSA